MKLQFVFKFSASRVLGWFWPYGLFFFHPEHMEVTILSWNFNLTRFKSCTWQKALKSGQCCLSDCKSWLWGIYYPFSLGISSVWSFEYCRIKQLLTLLLKITDFFFSSRNLQNKFNLHPEKFQSKQFKLCYQKLKRMPCSSVALYFCCVKEGLFLNENQTTGYHLVTL